MTTQTIPEVKRLEVPQPCWICEKRKANLGAVVDGEITPVCPRCVAEFVRPELADRFNNFVG